jgi:hypothetical protein
LTTNTDNFPNLTTGDNGRRLVEIEVRGPDFTSWRSSPTPTAQPAPWSEATTGDLDRSLRQREIRRPWGSSDALRVVLAFSTGTWGQLTVFREVARPYISPPEVAFASSIAGPITDGPQRSLLLGGDRAVTMTSVC